MNENDLTYKPLGYSYRVARNVWAGEYPVWDHSQFVRQRQLRILTDFGINYFIDLTEYGEMPSYAEFLPSGTPRETLPIPNGGVPKSVAEVRDLFWNIISTLKETPDLKIYIHCHGGVGRTGTIVACWYIFFEHLTANEAIAKMRERFQEHRRSLWMKAPETEEQVAFIHEFYERYQDYGTENMG